MSSGMRSPFTSVELRWFLDGSVEDNSALQHWFENCSPYPPGEAVGKAEWVDRRGRVPDSYLLLAGYEDMGIKLREGAFQVKGLVADLGAREFAGGHAGCVQRWIKWSYAESPMQSIFDGSRKWTVEVCKRRAVRLLEFRRAGIHREVAPGTRIGQGIAFEMTDLRLGSRAFCTIAFEAFPDSASTREEFDDVAASFLSGLVGPKLEAVHSMSYPAWLNTVSA